MFLYWVGPAFTEDDTFGAVSVDTGFGAGFGAVSRELKALANELAVLLVDVSAIFYSLLDIQTLLFIN